MREDLEVKSAFKKVQREGKKGLVAVCLSCNVEFAAQTSRQREHLLLHCPRYLQEKRDEGVENSITLEAIAREASKGGNQQTLTAASSKLPFRSLSPAVRKMLIEKYALAVYMANLPFSLSKDPYFMDFIYSLNAAFTLPSRQLIADNELDKAYNLTYGDVMGALAGRPLHICVDESTNITKNRLMSISANNSARQTFFIKAENVRSRRLTAQECAQWIMREMILLTDGDLSLIASLATDTCETMFATWDILRKELNRKCKGILFVPCDAHGLQLLTKDIIERVPFFMVVYEGVQQLVSKFRNAPLQYNILRDHMMGKYNKLQSLIASVLTRWGTQYRAAESVRRNKDALLSYAADTKRISMLAEVLHTIHNPLFWAHLDIYTGVLEHIYEAQKMSESDNSHIGHVVPRWMSIYDHVDAYSKRSSFPDGTNPAAEILPLIHERMERQVHPLHWAAYYLDPSNINQPLHDLSRQNQITTFLAQMNGDIHERRSRLELMQQHQSTAVTEYFLFRTQEGVFVPENPIWRNCLQPNGTSNPRVFWASMAQYSPSLSRIAIRLFRAPCNSVPSERSFSAINFIHDKKRNRLSPEKVNKLTFVYMNRRILDRKTGQPIRWHELTDEELVELENAVLEHDIEDEEDQEDGGVLL